MSLSHLNGSTVNNSFGIPNNSTGSASTKKTSTTPDILINYNKAFHNATPIMFRDQIISEMYAILMAKQKPNVLLVGPAGSGKTSLAQELARQIANNEQIVPSVLKTMTVYELPISSIISGSSILGQLETKIKEVIDFAENNKVILFIDELHMLINNHSNSAYNEIAQILKPALARGKMHVIGATTTQEARDLLADPAFSRRFSRITVNEISQDEELEVLKQYLPSLRKHYHNKVSLADDLLPNVVTISDDVLRPQTHRPDSGLTLLDRVMGEAIANQQSMIAYLKKSNTIAANAIPNSQQAIVNLNTLERTAAKIASGMQNQPVLTKSGLQDALKSVMYQDDAKNKINKLLLTNQLGVFNPEQPLSMLLVGSSGVGKTMLSRLVANYVTKTEPIVLNMAEYSNDMSITRILGSSAGYIGSDSHAELPFDILDSNPYQVILLDEFDQASMAVQRLFMRVLDEGKLQLANNHMIDFSKAIIFITTNGNNSNYGEHTVGFNNDDSDTTINDLRSVFEDKVINRFTAIIAFRSLTRIDFINIMKAKYAKLIIKLKYKVNNLPNELSDNELEGLADKYYRPEFGARPVEKAIEAYVQTKI